MKKFKKIIPLILLAFTVFFAVIPAEAKSKKPHFEKPAKNSMLYVDDEVICFKLYKPDSFNYTQYDDYKILSVKSSNKRVATTEFCSDGIDWDNDGKGDMYIADVHIKARKAGTTKITVKYIEGGKKKTYTFNLRVFKYQSPVSEFMLGKKELSSGFGKYIKKYVAEDGRNTYDLTKRLKYSEIASYPITNSSLPIVSWKARKGYVIKSVRFATNNTESSIWGDISRKAKTLKNGQKVKIEEADYDDYGGQAIQIKYIIKGYKYLGYNTSKGYQIKTLYFDVDFEDE